MARDAHDLTEARLPRQRRAFSTFGGPVDSEGEPVEARALTRLFDVEPSLARALTHGFHSYAGRMHPSIARGALQRWSRRGGTVLDPFCGSGTVLVEAMIGGRRAIGVDASPLAIAIARTRTTTLGEAGRVRLVEEATRIAEESGERARKRQRPEIPSWARRELDRFHAHVALELIGLRELVMEASGAEADPAVGRALVMCFSSLLVKFMKAGPEAPRDGAEKRIARGIPSQMLVRRATELARALEELEGRTPPGTPVAEVHDGDAREVSFVADASVDLVLTSPPYAGTYDYAAQHDVRFTWLDLPRRRFRNTQLGARDEGLGTDPASWRAGRRRWLGEMARVLKPGGHAVLVVGDGVVAGRPEDGAAEVAAAARPLGFTPVARAGQERPIHDKRLAAIFTGKPRREHIVLLRR